MKTNKWKMILLVWSAMFPFSTVVSYILSQLPFIAHGPLVARTFCLTCLLVPYMVLGALPFLTRRFQPWLQANPGRVPTAQPQQILAVRLATNRAKVSKVVPRRQYRLLKRTGLSSGQATVPFQMSRMTS